MTEKILKAPDKRKSPWWSQLSFSAFTRHTPWREQAMSEEPPDTVERRMRGWEGSKNPASLQLGSLAMSRHQLFLFLQETLSYLVLFQEQVDAFLTTPHPSWIQVLLPFYWLTAGPKIELTCPSHSSCSCSIQVPEPLEEGAKAEHLEI